MKYLKSSKIRNSRGVTLAEMLLATVLIGISMAALAQIMGTMTLSASRLNNRTDAIDSCRIAIGRIAGDVRHAKAIGDNYGDNKSIFPNVNGKSIYGSVVPPSGWPASWDPPPYQLSSTCLILQQPVFYERQDGSKDLYSGMPLKIPKEEIQAGVPSETIEDLDTVIYKVVQTNPDPVEYSLQMCRIPGYNQLPKSSTVLTPLQTKSSIIPPQTIVHGITGPIDSASGVPRVFSFYIKTPTGLKLATDSEISTPGVNLVGISVDLDVKRPDSITKGSKVQSQQVGIHSEAFLRSNKNLVIEK